MDFATFVSTFREDAQQPSMPVLLVRLAHSDYSGRDNWPTVQAAQDWAARNVPGVSLVDSEPATLYDGLHLDEASYDRVGGRLAYAWLTLPR